MLGSIVLPPPSTKIENEWIFTLTPPYAFMARTGTALPTSYNLA
jgi:hypothetical protein